MRHGREIEPAIDRYIAKVRAIPVLDRETEHDVAILALGGDRAAQDRLVEANLRHAVSIALQYRRYGIPLSELIAEGNVGLMTAVRKFDPHRGTRFVTYAGYWIRAYVLDCVVRSMSLVGGGTGPLRSKMFFRLRRERARMGNLITDTDQRDVALAERFGVSVDRMREMLARVEGRDVSLNQPAYRDAATTLVDHLEADQPSQETAYATAQTLDELEGRVALALDRLDDRERLIVEERLMDEEGASLAALGRRLGISRERARQLEGRALKKLKDMLADFGPFEAAPA